MESISKHVLIDVRPSGGLSSVSAALSFSCLWDRQVETKSHGAVIGAKVKELCGVSVARAFPKRFVGDNVVELSWLFGWTVVGDDVW